MTNTLSHLLDAVTLGDMWQSNEDFHNRFLGRPANLDESLVAYREECGELNLACITEASNEETVLEAADVLYTVIGVLRSRGISFDEFLQACQQVISKNDAKTLETHYVNEAGKIAKK